MIVTRVAKHLFGDNLYFGHAALGDLLEHETLSGLVAMGVSGQRPTDPQRPVLDAIAVLVNSADPRIWPLKLTRLVSSYGGVLAGYCAGQLAIEGGRIGYWVTGHAAATLAALRQAVGDCIDEPEAVAQAVGNLVRSGGRILGFGVPLRPSDERMDALRAYATRTGLDSAERTGGCRKPSPVTSRRSAACSATSASGSRPCSSTSGTRPTRPRPWLTS